MSHSTVLFVCVHNAGHSQLAAGLAARHAGDDLSVLSAGLDPDEHVDGVMLASLAEIGIDRSDQRPTKLTEDLVRAADLVVALKPDLDIPRLPGVRYETWELPEPPVWNLDGLRPLREHLDHRVHRLVGEIRAAGTSAQDDTTRQPS